MQQVTPNQQQWEGRVTLTPSISGELQAISVWFQPVLFVPAQQERCLHLRKSSCVVSVQIALRQWAAPQSPPALTEAPIRVYKELLQND